MSVLVKGMKMPKTCIKCGWHEYYGGDYDWYHACQMTGSMPIECSVVELGRADNCPLVELPEKHGKLIDGIELIDYCKDMIRLSRENDEDMKYIIISKICYTNVIGQIVNMPTLLEAEGE